MNNNSQGKAFLTGNALKLIAMLLMLLDHAAVVILENHFMKQTADYVFVGQGTDINAISLQKLSNLDMFFRLLGRPSFFLFAFLLVEGFLHTGNLLKYASRLLIFAFLSELPFDYALMGKYVDFTHQNIYFTLFLGLVALIAIDYFHQKTANRWINSLLTALSVLVPCLIAYFLRTDYGIFGVAVIAAIYLTRKNLTAQWVSLLVLILVSSWFGLTNVAELFGLLAVIPISFYNGERGSFNLKYLFYAFYPVHLILLGLLPMFVF